MRTFTHDEQVALRTQDWSLNVKDEFHGLSTDAVKVILEARRNNLIIGFENALRDFNFSGIIRGCNAFACQAIFYTGHRKYDPRGAVGTKHYEDIRHFECDMSEIIEWLRGLGYRIVVAESDVYENSQHLPEYQWNDKTFLIFGEEVIGVDQSIIDLADDVVYINQFGSVRSMNVAATAHIFVYDYMVKTGRL